MIRNIKYLLFTLLCTLFGSDTIVLLNHHEYGSLKDNIFREKNIDKTLYMNSNGLPLKIGTIRKNDSDYVVLPFPDSITIPKMSFFNFEGAMEIGPLLQTRFGNYLRAVDVRAGLEIDINFSLWRGMEFIGKGEIPFVNKIHYTDKQSRPTHLTISQTIPFNRHIAAVTFGVFNQRNLNYDNHKHGRFGFDLFYRVFFLQDKLFFKNRFSITRDVTFHDGKFHYVKKWLPINRSEISYLYPRYNFMTTMVFGRYIHGDWGGEFHLKRAFNRTSIKLWAQVTSGGYNGGFTLSMPLYPWKRLHTKKWHFGIKPQYTYHYKFTGLIRIDPLPGFYPIDYGVFYEIENSYLENKEKIQTIKK